VDAFWALMLIALATVPLASAPLALTLRTVKLDITAPTDKGLPLVKGRSGSWQVAQATVPSPERRGSKNSF
jgi:hypothetical protein